MESAKIFPFSGASFARVPRFCSSGTNPRGNFLRGNFPSVGWHFGNSSSTHILDNESFGFIRRFPIDSTIFAVSDLK
jgi:hypothetical protein